MNLKILSIISLSLLLFACSSRQKTEIIPDPVIITEWRTFDCGEPPVIDFIDLKEPTWRVIDGNFTLTPDEYAKLGESFSMIIKAAKQLMKSLDYYEQCIDSANYSEGA